MEGATLCLTRVLGSSETLRGLRCPLTFLCSPQWNHWITWCFLQLNYWDILKWRNSWQKHSVGKNIFRAFRKFHISVHVQINSLPFDLSAYAEWWRAWRSVQPRWQTLVLVIFPFRCFLHQCWWCLGAKKMGPCPKKNIPPCLAVVQTVTHTVIQLGKVLCTTDRVSTDRSRQGQIKSWYRVCHFCKIGDVFLLIHSWLVLWCGDNFILVILCGYLQF